jgi:hypothetical protein
MTGCTRHGTRRKRCSGPAGVRLAERDRQGAGAEKETLATSGMKEAASVGVRNLSLAVASSAFNGIDFAARLCRLHHHREARSIAGNARMLFDLLRHIEPFRPATEAASFSARSLPSAIGLRGRNVGSRADSTNVGI